MSNYKAGKTSLYSEADNAARKNRNSGGVFEGIGPNASAKPYSATGPNPAKQEAAKYTKKNKKQPVRIFTPEERKAYVESKMKKLEHIESTPDGKQEIVPGIEPLKKPMKKSAKDRWQELKKKLDNETAFMPMMEEEEPEEGSEIPDDQDPQNLQQSQDMAQESENDGEQNLQQGEENPEDGSQDESEIGRQDLQQGEEDPEAAEAEVIQALKDTGHSDAEIAYIMHGHVLPPPDLEAEKVKSEAMSGQTESQIAQEEHAQNKQHRDMEMQTNLEHQKKMNELAQQEAAEKKGTHKIDQDHKKRMADLEFEHAKKQKDYEFETAKKQKELEMGDAEAGKGFGAVENEHKKRMLDLEYENAKKQKEVEAGEIEGNKGMSKIEADHKKKMLDLEYETAKKEKELKLKLMEAEHKQKLKLMEESHKHKGVEAKEKHKQKLKDQKVPKQPLKKSEEEEDAGE